MASTQQTHTLDFDDRLAVVADPRRCTIHGQQGYEFHP